nr:hypothetical protein BdHM001_23230 [Bdellovibrio sp. HM001]
MNDSAAGIFLFGYDSSVGNGTPTADGPIHGIFTMSPDKNYILGYDLVGGVYFAGSR